jgi:hypothetical protein
MSKDFDQGFAGADESDVGPPRRCRSPTARERPFKLGPLGSLNQIIVALGKSIRAMADGTLDSQVGARICNGLGIMRACLETRKLEQLEGRMDEIADRVANERTGAARERTSTHEAQRLSY